MEAASRTKSPRKLRPLVMTSNLLVAVVALLAIFAGVALIQDSSRSQKVQVLKVRGPSNIKRFDSKETIDDTNSNRTDIRRYKIEIQSKASSSVGDEGNIWEESALPGKPTTTAHGWKNFPYVLVAVGGLTLLTTLVGLLAIHTEPVFLLLTLAVLVSVLLILQAFALGVLVPLEDTSQANQYTAMKQLTETTFVSFESCVIPVLMVNCALSLIVLILCFVQFFLHRYNTQSPFKILHPI